MGMEAIRRGATTLWKADGSYGPDDAGAYGSNGGTSYTYGYDAAGEMTSQTNTLGQSITYAYDGAGHLTSIRGFGHCHIRIQCGERQQFKVPSYMTPPAGRCGIRNM